MNTKERFEEKFPEWPPKVSEVLAFVESEKEIVRREIEKEKKEIAYGEKDEPNVVDETWADFYQSKAEAWFAGWDKAIEAALEKFKN